MFDTKKLFSKIFLWLFVGLMITFCVGYYVQSNSNMMYNLFSGGNYLIIWIIEIVLGLVLSFGIRKLPPFVATVLYLLYAALTGLTFGTLFLAYKLESIIWVFGATSLAMLALGLVGYMTKLDLSKFGSILFVGLIALILLSVISLFVSGLDMVLVFISLIIFMGYVAFDVNAIKNQLYGIPDEQNFAIYGAFQLYLDFINLFIDLLRIFGKEK